MDLLHRSWIRALKARNLADKTLRAYGDSLTALVDHAGATQLGDLDRDAIRAFLADLTDRYAPATVSVRYRALQQFFKSAIAEEELERSPWTRCRSPVVPEQQPVDVLPTADARDLLKACKGTSFVDRRDTAIMILFLDTGMRLSELAGLTVDDLDMEPDVAFVLGKGRRPRGCPFGAKAGQALAPVSARTHEAPSVVRAGAVARREDQGPDDRQWHRKADQTPRPQGRYRRSAPAPVPPYLRAHVAVGGRHRGRSDAGCGLARQVNAQPLRRRCSRRPRP